jgi:hypothetical protein
LTLVGKFGPGQWLCTRLWQWLGVWVTSTTSSATLALLLIRLAHVVEFGQVHHPRVSTNVLGNSLGVCFNLMCFQVHLRFENNKLLFQALWVKASEMIFCKMLLKGVVINVILLLAMGGTSITDVTAFVLITTMSVELVVAVKSLATEPTLGVPSEATLVYSSRLVVTGLFVFA